MVRHYHDITPSLSLPRLPNSSTAQHVSSDQAVESLIVMLFLTPKGSLTKRLFCCAPLVVTLSLILNLLCGPFCSPVQGQRLTPNGRNHPTVGLALGGGGTRGYAHIGVLRVLQEHAIPISCIAGTSIGSVIGGMFCAGLSCDEIERHLRDRAFYDSFQSVPTKLGLVALPIAVMPRALIRPAYAGLYKGDKFAAYISSHLPKAHRTVESLSVPFCAVACDLISGKACAITSGELGRAIQASCAIPELRQPVFWQEKLFADGGIIDNLPSDMARAMGAEIVIAVNVDEAVLPVGSTEFRQIGSVSDRCVTISLGKMDQASEKLADTIIHPSVTGIKLLSRNDKDMERAIKEGEKAALEALPRILSLLRTNSCCADNRSEQAEQSKVTGELERGVDRNGQL